MVHNGALGGGAEQAAEMVFCDVKMIRDVIQGSDGAVILIDIGDKLGNEGRAGFLRFFFCSCGLAVGLGKQGKDSDEGWVGAVKILFCRKATDLEQELYGLLVMLLGKAEVTCLEACQEKGTAFFREIPVQIAFVKIHECSFIACPAEGFVHAVGRDERNIMFFQGAGVIQGEQCVFPFLQKEQFVGVMVVKSAHVIVLGVFCVFYLDHFFRGIEVVVHGGSFVAHGSGTCMRMDGTVLIRQNPSGILLWRHLVNISKIL